MPKDKPTKISGPWKPGQSGNPNGRPKRPEIEALRVALKKVETKKKISFLEHCIERAYENDFMAKAILAKLIPDKNKIDIDIPQGITVKIVKFARGNNNTE